MPFGIESLPPLGFWGSPTSSIDWCEKNYTVCHFIAEFWNTVTSSFITILGLLGMYLTMRERTEKRFTIMYAAIVVVGLGSVAFHATLLLQYQLLDELPMVWGMLCWVYTLRSMESPRGGTTKDTSYAYGLAVFGVVWGAASPWVHSSFPIIFQALFVGLVLYTATKQYHYYQLCTNEAAKTLFIAHNSCMIAGAALWLVDHEACNYLHYLFEDYWWHRYVGSLHGYWHALMAVNVYLGPIFAIAIRAQMLGEACKVRWWGGVIPYAQPMTRERAKSMEEIEVSQAAQNAAANAAAAAAAKTKQAL